MKTGDLALMRGWIHGVSWEVLGELYLDDADRKETMTAIAALAAQLATKARRLGWKEAERFWSQPRENEPDWPKQACHFLERLLASPEPVPTPDGRIDLWLSSHLAAKLSVLKLTTLLELAAYINDRGGDWWQNIPHVGAKSAATVQAFFEAYRPALALSLDLNKITTKARLPAEGNSSDIAPLERFVPPEHINGATGVNRAPAQRCKINAGNDYQAIRAWLSLWDSDSATYRSYRKEAERFLLWAILEKNKAFSSLDTTDCGDYRRFLANPQPAERWQGQSAQRWSRDWRPFKGALQPTSIRQAEVILSALCDWLVGQRFLDSNPYTGLSAYKYPKRNLATHRAFSHALWNTVFAYAQNEGVKAEHAKSVHRYYRRIHFILLLAYQTGLRLEELVNAKVGDLTLSSSPEGDQCWLGVVGKGQKYREVPLSPEVLSGLNQHLKERGLLSLTYASPETRLIGRLRGSAIQGISPRALFHTLKGYFKEVADAVADHDALSAAKLKQASTHWLRHTHGSHAVDNGIPLAIVRDNLGHADISTTSIYVHTERDQRYRAIVDRMPSRPKND